MAIIGMIMKNRPTNVVIPPVVLYQNVLTVSPPNAEPLFPAQRGECVEDLGKSVWTGIWILPVPKSLTVEIPEKVRMTNGKTRTRHRHLDIVSFDLLPEVFWSPPHHEACDKDSQDDVDQHSVHSCPTPPKMISLSMMLTRGTMPPSGVKESCQPLMAPQLASVVTVANKAEFAMPKRTSLPSMLPPDWETDACCATVTGYSGLPWASAQYATVTPARNRRAIADQTAQPWAGEPVIRPEV